MKTKAKKYKLEHDFPFVEFCGIGTFLFLLGISVKRYFTDFDVDLIFIISGIIAGLFLFYWLTNSRNKTIIFEDETIKIKSLLGFSSTILEINELEGYYLKETYTRWGLDYHYLLVTKKNKNYEFIKDAYSNYHRLPTYLKNYNVKFLGKREIKWKYKHIYSSIGIYASIISIVLFLLLQLIKLLN